MSTDLIIPRDKWLRGEGDVASRLLRTRDSKMCCLGLYLAACGVPLKDIENRTAPTRVVSSVDIPAWLAWPDMHGAMKSTADANRLMAVNDSTLMGEMKREEEIAFLFAKNGVEVRFVDTVVEPNPNQLSLLTEDLTDG